MGMIVYWTQFAKEKLEDIYEYYSIKASSRVAHKLIEGLINQSTKLEKYPFIGKKELLLVDRLQEFRYLVYINYKIVYWINIEKEEIEIVNIFDCRQYPEEIEKT